MRVARALPVRRLPPTLERTMRRSPIPPVLAGAVVCDAHVLASLGCFGVFERRISLGSRTGHITYDKRKTTDNDNKNNFGASLGVLGMLAGASRF